MNALTCPGFNDRCLSHDSKKCLAGNQRTSSDRQALEPRSFQWIPRGLPSCGAGLRSLSSVSFSLGGSVWFGLVDLWNGSWMALPFTHKDPGVQIPLLPIPNHQGLLASSWQGRAVPFEVIDDARIPILAVSSENQVLAFRLQLARRECPESHEDANHFQSTPPIFSWHVSQIRPPLKMVGFLLVSLQNQPKMVSPQKRTPICNPRLGPGKIPIVNLAPWPLICCFACLRLGTLFGGVSFCRDAYNM